MLASVTTKNIENHKILNLPIRSLSISNAYFAIMIIHKNGFDLFTFFK